MEYPKNTQPLIPSWSPNPIPNLSLSAGGLLALADLNTVAQRTAITGGSSWLDALVLAPGLHYQQAADALDHSLDASAIGSSDADHEGGASSSSSNPMTQGRLAISNAALIGFLRRLWAEAAARASPDGTLTLDVSMLRDANDDKSGDGGARGSSELGWQDVEKLVQSVSRLLHRRPPPEPAAEADSPAPLSAAALPVPAVEMDWLSHLFYLLSPLLTTTALTFMILLGDWWGLAFILSLMLSRILNIWSIKQRSRSDPAQALRSTSMPPERDGPAEYAVDLGNGRRAVLRGLHSDLAAVTTQTRLREKSNLDSYLEAAAKLLVYLVAAFSGNLSQAGAIVLMALLLISAGLLGLSNSHARGLQANGRVARLQRRQKQHRPHRQHVPSKAQRHSAAPTDAERASTDMPSGESALLRLS